MSRARSAYRSPVTKVVPARFDKATMERLRKICPDPAFIRHLALLAGFVPNERRLGEPSDAALLATLADIVRRANDLQGWLEKLHPRLATALQMVDVQVGCSDRSLTVLADALKRFARLAPYASRRFRSRTGRRDAIVERRAAEAVRTLFAAHGLPFQLRDDRRSRKDNAAAFCVRLVLGLPESQRVEHYLRSALRSAPPKK